MSESRYTNYPNAWCPLTDPHQAMLEAVITIGFANDSIKRAETEPTDERRAATAVSALKWIVESLDSNFTEDFEARCISTKEAFEAVMGEDDFVQAGIAAREALKNINTNEQ